MKRYIKITIHYAGMDKNYDYFMKANVEEYIGEWIVICNQRIVSHGKDVKKVFEKAKLLCPKERPFLARIPEKDTMIL